jgi:predicted lipoprotein with Yx(FWY)xxD motif
MRRLLALSALLAALALAACGEDDDETVAETTPTTTTAESPPGGAEGDSEKPRGGKPDAGGGTEIVVAESQFGSILFDADQQAIYLFDKESTPKSECYGACAEAWPPVLTDGEPQAGDGADAKLLGTTERDDGSTQVTYNGHPLYFYAHEGPGEVLCHNVSEFGGLWLVLERSGNPVA